MENCYILSIKSVSSGIPTCFPYTCCSYVCLSPETACEKRRKMGFTPASLPPRWWLSVLGRKMCLFILWVQIRNVIRRSKVLLCQTLPVNCGELGRSWSGVTESGPIMSACLCQIVYTWLHMCVCGDVEGGKIAPGSVSVCVCVCVCVCTTSFFRLCVCAS